ncbi:antibiotic biosynthesis monooxygenase [Fulvivirgaceae bacterium BMA10]|uniref:Antibiotic biosynthesis monooxygenase n=1 Tax=Splendidivirga corallicola TaxID=3051826 RepID=A0ABT8KXK7_9BACT|nr:antibiotic biosynthesis monooxygenase [Fulvivirgaceae bacterium BMA10]
MVRVVYRWHVAPENFEEFKKIWSATTNRIHESVIGALGSFLLRSFENETEVITIAKWESLESWKNFWGNENPKEMQAMRKLGKRISAEVFEEVEDHTR